MTEPVFELVPATSAAPLLLLCDHASNALPAAYGRLGLAPHLFETHIAYDIGAADVTRALAAATGAAAVLGGSSRLLIDLNRGADDPTLVMKLSDGSIIPGNRDADAAEIAARIANFHAPYHAAIAKEIERLLNLDHAHHSPARAKRAGGEGGRSWLSSQRRPEGADINLAAQFYPGLERPAPALGGGRVVGSGWAAGKSVDEEAGGSGFYRGRQ